MSRLMRAGPYRPVFAPGNNDIIKQNDEASYDTLQFADLVNCETIQYAVFQIIPHERNIHGIATIITIKYIHNEKN